MSQDNATADESASEPVGSVAEEAGRLLDALQGWASRSWGAARSGAAAGGRDAQRSAPYDAFGGAAQTAVPHACQVCPLCQLLAALKERSPDAYAHVADALGSLSSAARSLLDAAAPTRAHAGPHGEPPPGAASGARPSPVQRIDVT